MRESSCFRSAPRVFWLSLSVVLIFSASVDGQEYPQTPYTVGELADFMNQCIAIDDIECLMSVVEKTPEVDEEEHALRTRWETCLATADLTAINHVDFDLSYLQNPYQKDGFIYSLPSDPVGLILMSCDFGSFSEASQHWIAFESGRPYVMRWRSEPIKVDPVEIRRIVLSESDGRWEQLYWVVDQVRMSYPRRGQEFYETIVTEAVLDLLDRGMIVIYKTHNSGYPRSMDVRDEQLTPARTRLILDDAAAWTDSDNSIQDWHVWYNITSDGQEMLNDFVSPS